MSADQTHTTILHTDERVRIVVGAAGSDRWHRVLNILWDEGIMASLSDRSYRVLGALLRLRKDDGTAFASPATLRYLTGHGERSVQIAIKDLREHPRQLITQVGRDVYQVLPAYAFAGRTVVRPPAHGCAPERTVVRPTCAPYKETRARQTIQPKQREIDPERKPEAPAGILVGWPIGIEDRRKASRLAVEGDVYGLLLTLGVWAHWASPISGSLHATPARILAMAQEVLEDPTAGNRPYCLGWRLGQALGVELPKSPARAKLTAEGLASGMEGIAKLRLERMRKQSVQRQTTATASSLAQDRSSRSSWPPSSITFGELAQAAQASMAQRRLSSIEYAQEEPEE